jgi:hypothetical protein
MQLSRFSHSRQLLATCLFRTPLGSSSSRHFIVTERSIASSVAPIHAAAARVSNCSTADTDIMLGAQIMRMLSSSSSSSKGEEDEGGTSKGRILKPLRWITLKQTSKALGKKGSKWSAEEDEKLVMLHESGLTWVEIAAHFEGRKVRSCQADTVLSIFV